MQVWRDSLAGGKDSAQERERAGRPVKESEYRNTALRLGLGLRLAPTAGPWCFPAPDPTSRPKPRPFPRL